jgi:hypothetical protein
MSDIKLSFNLILGLIISFIGSFVYAYNKLIEIKNKKNYQGSKIGDEE